MREPLVHFLILGAALFLVFGLSREPDQPGERRVVVTADQVEQLAAQFSRTWLRPPTPDELDGLVELGPAYAVGSLGAYWTIQRTAMMS